MLSLLTGYNMRCLSLMIILVFFVVGTAKQNDVGENNQNTDQDQGEEYTYQKYQKQYSRTYQGEQREIHKAAFQKNLNKNKQGSGNKVNIFSDWTDEEMSKFFSFKPEQSFSKVQKNKQAKLKSTGFPTTFDYRLTGKVTPVRYQGPCGSCWAFVTTTLYEYYYQLQTNNYGMFSVQYILECVQPDLSLRCVGGKTQPALQMLNQTGAPSYQLYYYYADIQSNYTSQGMCINTKQYIKLPSFANQIIRSNSTTQSQIIYHLLNYGPVLVGVKGDHPSFINLWNGANQVNNCPTVNTSSINHVVLIIGYTATHWIVQNSWGPNWGKDGYAYVNRSMESDCGITKYANFFKTGMNVTEYPKEMVKITINMTDSKKNGWGWILGIRQNNVIVSNLSLTTATGNGQFGSLTLLLDSRVSTQIVVVKTSIYPSSQIGFTVAFSDSDVVIFSRVPGKSFTSMTLASFCISYCPTVGLGSSLGQQSSFESQLQFQPLNQPTSTTSHTDHIENFTKLQIILVIICSVFLAIIILLLLAVLYFRHPKSYRANIDASLSRSQVQNYKTTNYNTIIQPMPSFTSQIIK